MGWSDDEAENREEIPLGTDTVYCFDALTGEEQWTQSYPCRYQRRLRVGDVGRYGGPSATPTFDEATGCLYTLSVDGDLRCWDTKDRGRPVWARNLYDEHDVKRRPNVGRGQRDYGYTSSPLVLGDRLIVEVGGTGGTVMAFDKETGDRSWASHYKEPAGHSGGPARIQIDGADCVAALTLKHLVVMRADIDHEGETIDTIQWKTDFGCNIPTPAVIGNRLLITSGYNRKHMALFEASLNGLREKWTAREYATVASPVFYRDHVYLVDHSLKCVDLNTGELKWQGGGFHHGSCLVTAADDKIIVFGDHDLALVDALSDDEYHVLSEISGITPGACYPHVALSDGIIACKDSEGNLVALSVRVP